MEDSYILGIKRNGVSLKIDTLTFESDQSGYEYISNINRVSRSGGNGQYNITITDHNLNQGCPIGNGWKLILVIYIIIGLKPMHILYCQMNMV